MKMIIPSFFGILLIAILNACASPISPVGSTNLPRNDMPPTATLEIDGFSQEARLASYCWSIQIDGKETGGACMDSVGFPTAFTPLSGKSPITAQLSFATNETPDQISAGVFEASKTDAVEVKTGEYYIWSYIEGINMDLPPQIQQEVILDLDPGLYVFNVFTIWENKGEVSYGFFIEVK